MSVLRLKRAATMPTLVTSLVLAALVAEPARGAAAEKGFAAAEVEFHSGDVQLAGTLVLPSAPGPYPAIVFLHGSGPVTRDGALPYAERYARLGFASLAFDKRGTGQSGGAWTSASLEDLARDAVAAIEFLKGRPEVDGERIGFWGVSQAGWVATQATELSDDVAFMVIISGGGATPYESEIFSYQSAFAHAELAAEDRAAGLELIEKYFPFLGTGVGREEVEAGIAAAAGTPWFPYARLDRILPASEEGRRIWSWVANWDPRPLMERMTQPILILFGGRDTEAPAALSVERWRESLEQAGNQRFTIKLFPEAGHGIRLGHHGDGGERPPFAEGYHETMDTWLSAYAAGEPSG